jgi:hypothetical protein
VRGLARVRGDGLTGAKPRSWLCGTAAVRDYAEIAARTGYGANYVEQVDRPLRDQRAVESAFDRMSAAGTAVAARGTPPIPPRNAPGLPPVSTARLDAVDKGLPRRLSLHRNDPHFDERQRLSDKHRGPDRRQSSLPKCAPGTSTKAGHSALPRQDGSISSSTSNGVPAFERSRASRSPLVEGIGGMRPDSHRRRCWTRFRAHVRSKRQRADLPRARRCASASAPSAAWKNVQALITKESSIRARAPLFRPCRPQRVRPTAARRARAARRDDGRARGAEAAVRRGPAHAPPTIAPNASARQADVPRALVPAAAGVSLGHHERLGGAQCRPTRKRSSRARLPRRLHPRRGEGRLMARRCGRPRPSACASTTKR